MHQIIIDPAAEEDIDNVFDWYEKQKTGLGFEFINALDNSLKLIARQPFHTFNVTEKVRRVVVNKFPYNVYYSVKENEIFIHVVMHQFRDPEAWQIRIGS